MGRYDGEEYEDVPPCSPDKHEFGMNGICFFCRHSRDGLLAAAKKTLEVLGGPHVR